MANSTLISDDENSAAHIDKSLLALIFGLISASSMPIGAVIGICFSPIPEWITAHTMAFGAGSLIYAVATELFGEALFALKFHVRNSMAGRRLHGRREECGQECKYEFEDMLVQCGAACVGALAFVLAERLLDKLQGKSSSGSESDSDDESGRELQMMSKAERDDSSNEAQTGGDGAKAAFAMWMGQLLDSIPEALVLGFMTKDDDLSFVLVVSIFIANFPEAFSAAAISHKQGMAQWKIHGMWWSIFILTGVFTMVGAYILPDKVVVGSHLAMVKSKGSAIAEGFAGGSMFAMIATAMLPHAFHHAGTHAGITFLLGFVASVMLAECDVRFGGTEEFEG